MVQHSSLGSYHLSHKQLIGIVLDSCRENIDYKEPLDKK